MRKAHLYPIKDLRDGSAKLLRVIEGSVTDNAIQLAKKVRSMTGLPLNVELKVTVDPNGKITIKQSGT